MSTELKVNIIGNAEEKLEKLREKAEGVTKSIEKINGIGAGLLGAFGLGAGIFEVFDIVKESVNEYRDLIKQQEKVQMLLINTGNNIKGRFQEIKEISEQIGHNLAIPTNEVMKVSAALINVGKIAKNPELFKKAENLTYNMAAATGRDPLEVVKQLSRLIQDPTKASRLLMAAGIGSHDLTQAIEQAVKLGHANEAQEIIINALSSKYKDFAETLAKQDPFFEFNQSLVDLKETLGPLSTQIAQKLMPEIINLVKRLTDWLKTLNSSDIQTFVSAIKLATEALLAMAALSLANNARKLTSSVGKEIFGIGKEAAVGGAAGTAAAAARTAETTEAAVGEAAVGGEALTTEAAAGLAIAPEIIGPLLVTAAVVAGAYGLYQILKGKDKQENTNKGPKITSLKGHFEQDKSTYDLTPHYNNYNDYMNGKQSGVDTVYTGPRKFVQDTTEDNSGFGQLPPYVQNYLLGKVVAPTENAKDTKKQTDFEEAAKKLLDFEKKWTSDLKVQGQSNKQFNITINGGLIHDMTNEYNNSSETADDVEKVIIDGIVKSLNALPGYVK